MASTVGSRMVSGLIVGTGALVKVAIPDFTPRKVRVVKHTGTMGTLDWNAEMPHGAAFKVIGGTESYVTADGITPVEQMSMDDGSDPGRGFTLGADTDFNVLGEDVFFEAWE